MLDMFAKTKYDAIMNWINIVADLRKHATLREIAAECGFASEGHVHDICSGRKKSVGYEIGVKLTAMHKKIMRRKQK